MESLGLKKSPVAFISRVSFRGGEENKIKRREKVFPLLLISNGKGKREIKRESRLKQLFHYKIAWKFEKRSLEMESAPVRKESSTPTKSRGITF